MFHWVRTPGDLALAAFLVVGGVLTLIKLFQWLLHWMDDRGIIVIPSGKDLHGGVGNAVLEVQAALQPEKKYVLEMKRKDEQKKIEAGIDGQ